MEKAKWIWYPGDYETALFNKCMAERYERDVLITPFWRMDTHYVSVKFYADFTLTKTNRITVKVDGTFNIFIEEVAHCPTTYCVVIVVIYRIAIEVIYLYYLYSQFFYLI